MVEQEAIDFTAVEPRRLQAGCRFLSHDPHRQATTTGRLTADHSLPEIASASRSCHVTRHDL